MSWSKSAYAVHCWNNLSYNCAPASPTDLEDSWLQDVARHGPKDSDNQIQSGSAHGVGFRNFQCPNSSGRAVASAPRYSTMLHHGDEFRLSKEQIHRFGKSEDAEKKPKESDLGKSMEDARGLERFAWCTCRAPSGTRGQREKWGSQHSLFYTLPHAPCGL